MRQHPLGIYEKALPKHLSWPERLALAKACGFDFVEMSVDESDERLARLSWSKAQRLVADESWLTMRPGNFAVFFPQDVHRPACINQRPCAIRKVVVKIPLASFSAR